MMTFYHMPETIEEMTYHIAAKLLEPFGIEAKEYRRWSGIVEREVSMKILSFGSLNIDYVYKVPHFVKKGETLSAQELNVYTGGKGLDRFHCTFTSRNGNISCRSDWHGWTIFVRSIKRSRSKYRSC